MRARATPRPIDPEDDRSSELHPLGLGADEYELEVDADRGMLLRVEARFEGQAFSIVEATEVHFDPAFDTETFRFVAPEGAERPAACT